MGTTTKKQETMSLISTLAEIAYDGGFADGLDVGKQVGFVAGVLSLKSALSSGVRHGSPECGKALESLKRIGIDG
ncbi:MULTISPECIES: hypothetical protein [Pseudomonas]|uniref:hypothetical protein n=2 Tax=Pseudomonas TaxID=286 RepID=UPI0016447815|nr:hypothetical protein [Pseudomonas mosselii]MBC3455908.1 hypothetical protein [Pseudomonas mosselii]